MKRIPVVPQSMLARILTVLYSDDFISKNGMRYYDLLKKLLLSREVVVYDFNEALKCERFVTWDTENDRIYPNKFVKET